VVCYLAMGDTVGAEAGYYDFMEARALNLLNLTP
jgi:hypothetical protein